MKLTGGIQIGKQNKSSMQTVPEEKTVVKTRNTQNRDEYDANVRKSYSQKVQSRQAEQLASQYTTKQLRDMQISEETKLTQYKVASERGNVNLADKIKNSNNAITLYQKAREIRTKIDDTNKGNNYEALKTNLDFKEKSKPVYKDEMISSVHAGVVGGVYMNGKLIDSKPKTGLHPYVGYMNDDEKSIYNYLYNTKGEKDAEEYVKFIRKSLNERQAKAESEINKKYAEEHPVDATVSTILSAPVRGVMGTMGTVSQNVKNNFTGRTDNIDINSDSFALERFTQDARETVTKDMNGLGAFLYNTGTSIGENLVTLPFGGTITIASLAGSAFSNAAYDSTKRGATAEQALTMGVTSALVEGLTEKIGLDNLFKVAKGGIKSTKKVVVEALKQAGIEGTEELISEIANTIADNAIMGEESNYNISVRNYVEDGKSLEEAKKLAMFDILKNVGVAFASGALSGGVMGTGASTIGYIKTKQMEKVAATPSTEGQTTTPKNLPIKTPVSTEGGISLPTSQADVESAMQRIIIGTGTNKDFDLFKPANVKNRTMFENATGVKLPTTNAETRKFLREYNNNQNNLNEAQESSIIEKNGGVDNVRTISNSSGQQRGTIESASEQSSPIPEWGQFGNRRINELVRISNEKQSGSKEIYGGKGEKITYTPSVENARKSDAEIFIQNEGKKYGVDVEYVTDLTVTSKDGKVSKPVAFTDGNKVVLSDKATFKDAAHEFSHEIKRKNPKKYEIVKTYIKNNMDTGLYNFMLNDYINEYSEIYGLDKNNLTDAQMDIIEEELICDIAAYNKIGENTTMPNEAEFTEIVNDYYNNENNKIESERISSNALGVRYAMSNKSEQYGVMWTIAEGIATEQDVAEFYHLIGEYEKGTYTPLNTYEGDLYETTNNIFYTDGNYLNPIVNKVIGFNTKNLGVLNILKDVYIENARTGIDSKANCEIIEAMQGKGIVSSRDFGDVETLATRTNSGRNRKHSKRNTSRDAVKDAIYENAVQNNDMETAQRMVDEKAVESGVHTDNNGNPVGFYHGTSRFGWTMPNLMMSDDEFSFFATEDIEVANTYARLPVAKQGQIGKKSDSWIGPNEESFKQFLEKTEERGLEARYNNLKFFADDAQKMEYVKKSIKSAENWARKMLNSPELTANDAQKLNKFIDAVQNNDANAIKELSGYMYLDAFDLDTNSKLSKMAWKFGNDVAEIFDVVRDNVFLNGKTIFDYNDISGYNPTYTGIYKFYAKTGKTFELDCKGARWNRLPVSKEIYDYAHNEYGIEELGKKDVTTRAVAHWAFNNGYDSVKFLNVVDTGNGTKTKANVWAFKDPKQQLWSADPVTYDDNDNVIPLSDRFKGDDIRFSTDNIDKSPEYYQQKYNEYLEQYGAIKKGMQPRLNDVEVPRKTAKNQYVSKFARTMAEADGIANAMDGEFEKMVVEGKMSHEKITDKEAYRKGLIAIKDKGFADSVKRFEIMVNEGRLNKEDIVEGQILLNVACQNKDVELAKRLAVDLSLAATQFGQNVQAFSMLKKMSPDGQLYYLEKSLQKINQEILDRFNGKFKGIEIDNKLAENLLNAKNQKEINDAVYAIEQNIGKQIPASFLDKWNAWRYLAMLGNTRTHIRNIVGNAVFAPARGLKNIISAGIQSVVLPKAERTKSLVKTKESEQYADKDWNLMAEIVKGNEGKYGNIKGIEEHRKIFKTKWLEAVRKFNTDALEIEDGWFLESAYKSAFAQAMTARGLSTKYLNSNTKQANEDLQKIREYAIREAQKATFRDTNTFSEMISNIKFRKSDKLSQRGADIGNTLIEGVLPFKKTPANILVRGVEYSPIGLIKGITTDIMNVKKGKISAAQAIDNISAGLVGTGICALGALMAHLGWLVVTPDEDDDIAGYKKMLGAQNYALKIGNHTYTIDWMAPAALPLFVGAEVVETFKDTKDFNFKTVTDALSRITEPMFELSCLSGVKDALESIKYSDGNVAVSLATEIASNYFAQGIPTIGGQLARVIDDTQRNAYYKDKNSILPEVFTSFIEKAMAKTPGLSMLLPEKVDRWGRVQKYGKLPERLLENFVSPGYYSNDKSTFTDKKLMELYEKTGDDSVLPDVAAKSFQVDGENNYLSNDEYVEYSKERGQLSYQYITDFLKNIGTLRLDDDLKVEVINGIYKYANARAKEKVSDYTLDKQYAKVEEARKSGISPDKYYVAYYCSKGFESDKNYKGNSITYSKSDKEMKAIKDKVKGVSEQKLYKLFEIMGYTEKQIKHFKYKY